MQRSPKPWGAVSALGALALATVAVAGCGGDAGGDAAAAEPVPRADVDRFDGRAAYRLVRMQVALGPRPAGSRASRELGRRLRRALPNGRFQPVPGGLRNVVGTIRGREPGRRVVVGAHYDTFDSPGFIGAVDGASGTAVVTELARSIRPRQLGPTVEFVLFDGEEAPPGTPPSQFAQLGLRGSRAVAPRYRDAEAMILLDFVGEHGLRLPREAYSHPALWRKLRRAARAVGVGKVFPAEDYGAGIQDDHLPFIREGVPSINLIDFDYPCWHRACDDLGRISVRSLDASGEAVHELLRRL